MSTVGHASLVGHAPVVTLHDPERDKYERMWTHEQYREIAPGEDIAGVFLEHARPRAGAEVIDFGTGTGRGALMLAVLGGLKVKMIDFAPNCLDADVRNALTTQSHVLSFTPHDLRQPLTMTAQYGYCTDVMEHIQPECVDQVLCNILKAAQHVFFQISCVDDVCGSLIGEPLHLSVHDHDWWLKKFKEFDCAVHWSRDCGNVALFYVSAWQDGQAIQDTGVLNVPIEQVMENVRYNINHGWQQATPHAPNEHECILLAGGPSINENLGKIQWLRKRGAKLITVNGSYGWALEHGLQPSAQIVVDAREFNKRFCKPITPQCVYLIASQAHPLTLEGLPEERTYLWHTTMEELTPVLDELLPQWYAVPGGSTVVLRALFLMRMLGYRKFHIFGFDSCLMGAEHHAYKQEENDGELVVPTIVGDRTFQCHAWQISQAHEFLSLVKHFGDEFEIEVYGDGLIAHILRTGAELADRETTEEN